jgi:hypothetical protein
MRTRGSERERFNESRSAQIIESPESFPSAEKFCNLSRDQ